MRKSNSANLPARLLVLALSAMLGLSGCGEADGPPADSTASFDYPADLPPACQAVWPAAEPTAARQLYLLRAPANYDPRFAHPLLVVYPYANATAEQTERYTRLTLVATRLGFIVAYPEYRTMGLRNIKAQGGVARDVAKQRCIDPNRVFMTGHSDGGTVATALALLPESRDGVSGIAPSAAGFNKADLQTMHCRARPIPVMVMHGLKDRLFPGWGREAAGWWAACNTCAAETTAPDANGCVTYSGCPEAAPVMYCEGPRGHLAWPGLEAQIVAFLATAKP